jgi:SAM-dependent methyltransferase
MLARSDLLVEHAMALNPSREIAASDKMFGGNRQHYFGVGRSAVMSMLTALTLRMAYRGGDQTPQTILDFGAGYGRVARFLRVAFPEARIEVTDVEKAGVAWCVENLACHSMGETVPQGCYDLIWVGSVITHLPEFESISLINTLKRALRPMGLLVLTTHGRVVQASLAGFASGHTDRDYQSYGLTREDAAAIVAEYFATGYGYHNYPNQTGYGITLTTPAWMYSRALDQQTIHMLFQEMGWDMHQDVFAFMRTGTEMHQLSRGGYFFGKSD